MAFVLPLHCSWLGRSLLKFGCFLMLSHCQEQGNEALAGFHCLGMVPSKCLLANCQRASIQKPGLLAVTLRLSKQPEMIHSLRCLGMLWSHLLFPDTQGTQVEGLRLRKLALISVEVCQVVERIGY